MIQHNLFIKILIIPSLFISPLLTMSCNSWFSIWMSMEFNLMVFIPFIVMNNKKNNIVSMKYFIIQAISSSILLMASNLLMINMNFYNPLINFISTMINLSILIKLGSAPFHNWFLIMMNSMNWLNCMILSTWQKLIPLISLMYLMNKFIIISSIIMSSFIGCVMGLNHKSLRLIMAYSSINHLSWMMLNLMYSEWLWMIYYLSYSISSISVMMMFKNLNLLNLHNLYYMENMNSTKFLILFNLLSLSGFPPTFGFLIKWMSIYNTLNEKSNFLIMMFMMIMSIMAFIYYIRICIPCFMHYNLSYKISLKSFKFFEYKKMSIIKLFALTFFPNLWIISLWIY